MKLWYLHVAHKWSIFVAFFMFYNLLQLEAQMGS